MCDEGSSGGHARRERPSGGGRSPWSPRSGEALICVPVGQAGVRKNAIPGSEVVEATGITQATDPWEPPNSSLSAEQFAEQFAG